ncbi:MAG: hypothetical protein ACLFTE_02815 [Salinivenus sp.]
MSPPRPVALRLWLVVLMAVCLGGRPAPAEAQPAGPSLAGPAPVQSAAPSPPVTTAEVALALRYGLPARDTAAASSPPDRWLARDKAQHVVFSGLWTLSTQYVLTQKAGWGTQSALPVSMGTAAAVGGAKEVYDAARPRGTASGRDLVANAVGIGLAAGLILW